jgi:hypothetical protein
MKLPTSFLDSLICSILVVSHQRGGVHTFPPLGNLAVLTGTRRGSQGESIPTLEAALVSFQNPSTTPPTCISGTEDAMWWVHEDAGEDDGRSRVWAQALLRVWTYDEPVLRDVRCRAPTVGSDAFNRKADGSKNSEA